MKKLVPRHSLVIAIGPHTENREKLLANNFDLHEIVSFANISLELIGSADSSGIAGIVHSEMLHRAALKLSLGERAVIDAPNLRREDRLSLAKVATAAGLPVFYLLADPEGADPISLSRWRSTYKDLVHGDGVAEAIDSLTCTLEVVPRAKPSLSDIARRWSGITVIGDVHGMQQSLYSALTWARSRNNYVIFLGDVIDYGPQTLEVADHVYSMVMRGEAELMLGNHERKIARWLGQLSKGHSSISLSDGNKVTTNALSSMATAAANHWAGRFTGLVANASHVRSLGDYTLAHASIHPNFWNGTATVKEIETSALFGEIEPSRNNSAFVPRSYRWVDCIPAGKTVLVGHDIRSKKCPMPIRNDNGGTAVFLDTGCGKGGSLSSVDLRMADSGLRTENFNMH